jgi:hypothetical protein
MQLLVLRYVRLLLPDSQKDMWELFPFLEFLVRVLLGRGRGDNAARKATMREEKGNGHRWRSSRTSAMGAAGSWQLPVVGCPYRGAGVWRKTRDTHLLIVADMGIAADFAAFPFTGETLFKAVTESAYRRFECNTASVHAFSRSTREGVRILSHYLLYPIYRAPIGY